MKFKTNEEIYDFVLKEIQKWFIKKYYGKIFQSFTFEAREILGEPPRSISLIEEDGVKIYCDYCNSNGMIIIIEITRQRTATPLFHKLFVYHNNSYNYIIYNLRNVERDISGYMEKIVISNDTD